RNARQRAPIKIPAMRGEARERPEAVAAAARGENGRRDAAGDHLVQAARDADPLGALLLVTDRPEVEAEPPALDQVYEPERDCQQPECDVVVADRLGAAGELEARE